MSLYKLDLTPWICLQNAFEKMGRRTGQKVICAIRHDYMTLPIVIPK